MRMFAGVYIYRGGLELSHTHICIHQELFIAPFAMRICPRVCEAGLNYRTNIHAFIMYMYMYIQLVIAPFAMRICPRVCEAGLNLYATNSRYACHVRPATCLLWISWLLVTCIYVYIYVSICVCVCIHDVCCRFHGF